MPASSADVTRRARSLSRKLYADLLTRNGYGQIPFEMSTSITRIESQKRRQARKTMRVSTESFNTARNKRAWTDPIYRFTSLATARPHVSSSPWFCQRMMAASTMMMSLSMKPLPSRRT